MRKENIIWKDGLPVRALAASVHEWPLHYHQDPELIYVLRGAVQIRSGGYEQRLAAGDIFVVNANEPHEIKKTEEDNLVLFLSLRTEHFAVYHPELEKYFFAVREKDQARKEVQRLRERMGNIMLGILDRGRQYQEHVEENAHSILDRLLADFAYPYGDGEKNAGGGSRILTWRLARVIRYVCGNYNRKLTLSEIAEKEGLSVYYLSHMMKECTTLSFQELLNCIRACESVPLLLTTEKTISEIAEEVGFSAVRYYIWHFESCYGMTPQEYRDSEPEMRSGSGARGEYVRAAPEEIRTALCGCVGQVGKQSAPETKSRPILITVEIPGHEARRRNGRFPAELMEEESVKLLARPYHLMQSLQETTLDEGMNDKVTASDGISILLCNFTEEIVRKLKESGTDRSAALKCAEEFNLNTGFLVKIRGASGDYKITRYKVSRESVIASYEEAIGKQNFIGRRKTLLNQCRTLPKIDTQYVSALSTLNLVSRLSGLAAELILIDRIGEER